MIGGLDDRLLDRSGDRVLPRARMGPVAEPASRVRSGFVERVEAEREKRLAKEAAEEGPQEGPRQGRLHHAPAGQGRAHDRPPTTLGCGSGSPTGCSTWSTPTSACGRSSPTSTSGTRRRRRPGSTRVSSQRWHRDYNDERLVKVFIYLTDVDEDTGPLEYVPGSTLGGEYAQGVAVEAGQQRPLSARRTSSSSGSRSRRA